MSRREPYDSSDRNVPAPGDRRGRQWTRWVGRNWARVQYGRHIEPTWLELTRHRIDIPQLPEVFHGFRIIHLSDLHAGHGIPLTYLHEVVELANGQAPDLIALTGDFIHKGYRYIDTIAGLMGKLSAPHGVYAVLGNHDFSVRNALGLRRYRKLHQSIEEALKERGIHVLRNRAVAIERSGNRLHLAGVDDLWSRACDLQAAFADVPEHGPRILLAHNPRTVHFLNGQRCDLMLSGHTHGGQINWPGLGRFLLSQSVRQFAAGLYQHESAYVYVNRGIGYGFRFRFGVRPEVALLHLGP